VPGKINVDFADVRSVMNQSGEALMGCGIASGENRASEAAQKAISSPLLEGVNIKGAKNILLNVTASTTLTMKEITEGNQIIYDAAGEEANVIFGLVQKEEMNEYVSYTVIATGFHTDEKFASKAANNFEEEKSVRKVAYTGYKPTRFEFDENADLDVPTIKRMSSTDKSFTKGEEPTQVRMDFFNQAEKTSRRQPVEAEESKDDSSSFLRMMMD